MAEPVENTQLLHEHKWQRRCRRNCDFVCWRWDVSRKSLIKNVAYKNEHFYSWDYYLGASSTLSWFSLNVKSIEVKKELVNFSRGSGIIPHSKVMVLHHRAFSILTSEQQTGALIKQPQQPSFSLQKSDIILLPNQLSYMLCLTRLGNISKYSTFDCCENV